MVQRFGIITSGQSVVISEVVRFEHHKIYVKVTDFVSNVTLRVEDTTIAKNTQDLADIVDLDPQGDGFIIRGNGVCSYLIMNTRMEELQINFVSGDATLEIFYVGW